MHHGVSQPGVLVQQRLVSQPEQQRLTVRGIQYLGDRIFLPDLDRACGRGRSSKHPCTSPMVSVNRRTPSGSGTAADGFTANL
ncbi:MAG: hypothetical protein LJE91_15240 [Gammaproteobacteria bacterium]|jgi:hypothetical protein|nr:hypothetical protein [Gammaproteobacteria bacterium]